MKVLSYNYVKPNNDGVVEMLDHSEYMTSQYINHVYEYLHGITLEGKCAFIYAGGVLLTAGEARNTKGDRNYRVNVNDSGVVIKETAAYSMHKWIGQLNGRENICYATINGNTCASSMHCLHEAEQLLNNGFDQVIIVAEEKTSYNTLRIFDEHNIDLKVGEGMAIIHLGKAASPSEEDITQCKTWFEYNRNPFGVTESGYKNVITECDLIKPHGTGTENNEEAETKVYGEKPQIRYKETYGHTQGTSGLLEVCMVMDENLAGDVLCVSSGMGGFYASCIVHKGK